MEKEYREKNVKDIEDKFQQQKGGWQEALSKWADKNLRSGTAEAQPSPSPSPMSEAIRARKNSY